MLFFADFRRELRRFCLHAEGKALMSEVAQHGSDSMSRMPFVRTEDGFGNLVVSLRAADKVHVLIRRDLKGGEVE